MHFSRYAVLLVSLCLAGCLLNRSRIDLSQNTRVFGIEIYSAVDYREINGVKAVEEPCLNGYERIFDPLEVTIGYGFDGRIRRITTRNPATALFTISPGTAAAEGKERAKQAGFTETSQHIFLKDDLSLTLRSDATGRLFSITLERID